MFGATELSFDRKRLSFAWGSPIARGMDCQRGMWGRFGVGVVCVFALHACGSTTSTTAGATDSSSGTSTATCSLTANTTATSTTTANCTLLSRDASGCEAERTAAGLSGHWLRFSCRVTLSVVTSGSAQFVQAEADGQPDYTSVYFPTTDACYAAQSGTNPNPNRIAVKEYVIRFPLAPDTTTQAMGLGVVGLAVNGVPIFNNAAAPGDDIYEESATFDYCQAHPTGNSEYHYHSEPYAITYDDDRFVGVMRDGYPVYGRRDSDGTVPTLDAAGGHTGVTIDSPTTPVYHHHVNAQTSTDPDTAGTEVWFITTGTYAGTPGASLGD